MHKTVKTIQNLKKSSKKKLLYYCTVIKLVTTEWRVWLLAVVAFCSGAGSKLAQKRVKLCHSIKTDFLYLKCFIT
jgi:hypothetical protein